MLRQSAILGAGLAAAALLFTPLALAAGTEPEPEAAAVTCDAGMVRASASNSCVAAEAGAVPDADLESYAWQLVQQKSYDEALTVLDLIQGEKTAAALNTRGYATRNLGRVDEGIGYYLEAIALDPTMPQVREYLGEAYLMQGKLDLAKEQLTAIEGICGTSCESYVELAEKIEAAT
jgi:tetratricopeptide (TPR) repeat protein